MVVRHSTIGGAVGRHNLDSSRTDVDECRQCKPDFSDRASIRRCPLRRAWTLRQAQRRLRAVRKENSVAAVVVFEAHDVVLAEVAA